MTVCIVDYGMGNLASVQRALEECGARAYVTDTPADLKKAGRIVIPGVGSFRDAMKKLERDRWIEEITEAAVVDRIPVLGICLGMQLLASVGTEGGECGGLGLIRGRVVKLTPREGERIPHVGWNEIHIEHDHPIFDAIPSGSDYYFVHSYHFLPEEETDRLGTTPYCGNFASVVGRDNIVGVQFHPEKSLKTGFQLLRNFLRL